MSTLNSYLKFLSLPLSMIEGAKTQHYDRLEEIKKEWIKSKEYPRKKKKAVRKKLLYQYDILSWMEESLKIYGWF